MDIKLLTEHHLGFLSFKGGCTGSAESTLVKMPHCWKSHATAQMTTRTTFFYFILRNEILKCCYMYCKTCLKRSLKQNTIIGFQDRFYLNAGQKCCRMLPREHSAILSTFIKLPFSNKPFILSILSVRLR